MSKNTRPKPAEVGEVRLGVLRGPRADGRWYWRARRKSMRDTVWTGWATRDEAMQAVAELVVPVRRLRHHAADHAAAWRRTLTDHEQFWTVARVEVADEGARVVAVDALDPAPP